MIDGIIERLQSRKTWGLIGGAAFFVAGATDAIAITTEQELLSGLMAVASIIMIGIVDFAKAWRRQ